MCIIFFKRVIGVYMAVHNWVIANILVMKGLSNACKRGHWVKRCEGNGGGACEWSCSAVQLLQQHGLIIIRHSLVTTINWPHKLIAICDSLFIMCAPTNVSGDGYVLNTAGSCTKPPFNNKRRKNITNCLLQKKIIFFQYDSTSTKTSQGRPIKQVFIGSTNISMLGFAGELQLSLFHPGFVCPHLEPYHRWSCSRPHKDHLQAFCVTSSHTCTGGLPYWIHSFLLPAAYYIKLEGSDVSLDDVFMQSQNLFETTFSGAL